MGIASKIGEEKHTEQNRKFEKRCETTGNMGENRKVRMGGEKNINREVLDSIDSAWGRIDMIELMWSVCRCARQSLLLAMTYPPRRPRKGGVSCKAAGLFCARLLLPWTARAPARPSTKGGGVPLDDSGRGS